MIRPADGNLPSHGFVPQPIGTGVGIVTFTLTNNESVPATELAITGLPAGEFTFTGGSYPGTTGTCTDTLAPGASCTVSIRFAPTVVGEDREIIDIHFTAARGPRSYAFTLSGSGT